MVHFPIGLLCVALLLEGWAVWRRQRAAYAAGIKALLYLGAASALLSVPLGLLLAENETYGTEAVALHQWTGIATALLSVGAVVALRRTQMELYRSLLTLAVGGVAVAGHFGAMLTHGDDYLSSTLPWNSSPPQTESVALLARNGDKPLDEAQIQQLSLEVRTILAHNCYSCHGPSKVKGELRLDSYEQLMKGGEHGVVVVAGKPEDSELIRRITLPTGHKEAMPTKGKRLTDQEVATLRFWIEQGAPWPSGPEKSIYRVADLAPRQPDIPPAVGAYQQPIDRFVNAYFTQNKLQWKPRVDDRTYLRRVYLDIVGLLPSPEKQAAFLADTRPNKREILVQELLNQHEAYAQHWLTFWNDALRNDYSGTGYITGGRFDITQWLYSSLKVNKPYDWFVRELLSPKPESAGFIKGIRWRGTINSSQTTEMQAAQNVAQVLLGLNLKCASCHDSFISDWKLEDAYAFANVFSDSTLEIHRCDQPTGKTAGRGILFKELGEISVDAPTEQRLRELADRLVQPQNGRLYRTLVNRVWAQLMGRGLVEPLDAMDNLPWSQDLLDWLAWDFAHTGYDLRQLIKKIVLSETYQLPSVAVSEPELLSSPQYVFEGMVRRRLSAEQFADAVSVVFAPVYADSAIVFSRFPATLPEEIPFARASLVKNDPFLTALGRPNRETVSTSRSTQASLLQALELTNGTHFNTCIEKGARQWHTHHTSTASLLTNLYERALGRAPTPKEIQLTQKQLGSRPTVADVQDLAWAVFLHPEFQLIY